MNKPTGNKAVQTKSLFRLACNAMQRDLGSNSNISSGKTCTFVLHRLRSRAFPVHLSDLCDPLVCRVTVKCCHVKCQFWSFKIISGRSNYNFDFHDLFIVLRKTHTLHLVCRIHTLNSSDIFRFLQRNG